MNLMNQKYMKGISVFNSRDEKETWWTGRHIHVKELYDSQFYKLHLALQSRRANGIIQLFAPRAFPLFRSSYLASGYLMLLNRHPPPPSVIQSQMRGVLRVGNMSSATSTLVNIFRHSVLLRMCKVLWSAKWPGGPYFALS